MRTQDVIKGMHGESIIRDKLLRLKEKYRFEFIYDMPVEKAKGGFQQCDFVVISTYGNFALEVKNWVGTLQCDGCSYCWPLIVQGRMYKAHNPILQNAGHIKWLRESYNIQCENVVLFADTCRLIDKPAGVYNFSELEKLFTMSPECVSWEEVQRQFKILEKAKADNSLKAVAQRFVKYSNLRGK